MKLGGRLEVSQALRSKQTRKTDEASGDRTVHGPLQRLLGDIVMSRGNKQSSAKSLVTGMSEPSPGLVCRS